MKSLSTILAATLVAGSAHSHWHRPAVLAGPIRPSRAI